jgi:predicted metal-dependent hydrolase
MRTITIEGIGDIIIKKSAKAKRVIMKINHENEPVVVIPKYIPYALGISFAKKNTPWIKSHLTAQPNRTFEHSSQIGKSHSLQFVPSRAETIRSRVQNNTITVAYPESLSVSEPAVQAEAKKAATRAVKKEAEAYLPRLLHSLATLNGYNYTSVSVKNMKSRWGSCSTTGVINLNIWLMQLPDSLIEYVCCHELAHLNNPHHQKEFWEELSKMIPDYRECKKILKTHSPSLNSVNE